MLRFRKWLLVILFFFSSAFSESYYFPLNLVSLGYYNNKITGFYANQYVTPPYLPIFWKAPIQVGSGVNVMYERNFFHTKKYISFNWGLSASSWKTHLLGNQFYAAAAFLDFNLWFVRTRFVDIYFTYAIAGPAYISQTELDNRYMGGHFIFQDALGFGALVGASKHINLSVKIGHYSNGSLLPSNPGIDIPILFSLGYAFG